MQRWCRRRYGSLTDEFLVTIAREDTVRGRGYATSLAEDYFVSSRTLISWVEKAQGPGFADPAGQPRSPRGEIARGH